MFLFSFNVKDIMYQEILKLSTKPEDIIDITNEVQEIVERSRIKNGICLIFNLGSTGAILINENDFALLEDFREMLKKLTAGKHQHPANAHSHLKAGLIGSEKAVPIKNGELQLGTWQSIMFCEFDIRPRERKILVTVIGE